ncbi:outer membrane beta-barrel protein [Spirosoma aureum]|uniref:Outer membrane beta-barrel protein n=1 Tax=Spirosoma aureum TaxID=2692134 RepID=A0A6G9ANY8_9BACT|nr:outer membrane beta-barrel protein [Spirosoma aureum]QIP14191.1 outer membrane beta-barrel protein [Spirosoma aureum]
MKKLVVLLLITIQTTNLSVGQSTESILALNSGLFSFHGVSAEKNSQINLASNGSTGYTNNPFGAKNGLSYGLSYQIQHITRGNFMTGISIGYENLRSKLTIDRVNGYDNTGTFQEVVAGQTYLSNNLINAFPFLGYRLKRNQFSIDLIGGLDIGYLLSSREKGEATGINGKTYSTSLDRTGLKTDLRPRVQVSGFYGRIGVYAGYAYGLRNYRSGWVGGRNECNAELIRFGILYKLKG